jgi:uncharacterized phage-associated protein
MASVFDVAKYILNEMGTMSTWKLQKLCYYAQAWTIAWDGCPLFDEEFQAWANGPICRELFDRHRGMFLINRDDLNEGSVGNLTIEQRENIDIIITDYGDKEPYWLRAQTHWEDPWRMARGDLPEGANSDRIITKDSMGAYYGSL